MCLCRLALPSGCVQGNGGGGGGRLHGCDEVQGAKLEGKFTGTHRCHSGRRFVNRRSCGTSSSRA